jgi:hypothetical protein
MVKFVPPSSGQVSSVEFWTVDATTDLDVYVYSSFNGTAPSNLLWSSLNHSYSAAGYHSVAVTEPFPIAAGNDLYVVVKFTAQTTLFPIPTDRLGAHETNRTWVSPNGAGGSWAELGQGAQEDVAIRLRISTG